MYHLVFTSGAKIELRHEANYSKKRWGNLHGKKYIQELQKKIKQLATNPLLCPLRDDILPDTRILNHKGNRIIYTIIENRK
ncbi:MAG: type II toxin-antitoxin system RelE/ParE family toxin [Proteobacteria bacterium]|nr:type II toxin-antitoxin system RelE/ParE family toxin [Pseudomonadota bacterium]